jgi:outer membrane protein assembly factor BamA
MQRIERRRRQRNRKRDRRPTVTGDAPFNLRLRSGLALKLWDRIPAVKSIHLALLVAGVSLLSAQIRRPPKPASPSVSKLISIKVTGSNRYAPDQIISATSLQLGQTVSEDDFKRVSQRLGESGAFNNVAYTYQFSSEGIKLDLQVTDSTPFVVARFENFVWLSDQELLQQLRARVPLFQGQLPVAGDLPDQVSEALQALAIEHHLQGRADYLRAGPQDGPIEAFDFSITGQTISVRNIAFNGASPAELPLLQAAAGKLSKQDYSRSNLAIQAEKSFLPVYLERGYLKASVAEPQPKVVQDSPEETLVDVIFPVTPGRQYKLTDLVLSGYKVFPVEKLREFIHLQPGEPANAVQVDRDVEAIKKLYGTRGYMGAQIKPALKIDDAQSTVEYRFEFQEGGVYKMGDLEIRGLDSRATERMMAAWKLRPGDAYDSAYSKQFVDSVNSLSPGDQWNITVHESVEDKDKVVDVSLRFDLKR